MNISRRSIRRYFGFTQNVRKGSRKLWIDPQSPTYKYSCFFFSQTECPGYVLASLSSPNGAWTKIFKLKPDLAPEATSTPLVRTRFLSLYFFLCCFWCVLVPPLLSCFSIVFVTKPCLHKSQTPGCTSSFASVPGASSPIQTARTCCINHVNILQICDWRPGQQSSGGSSWFRLGNASQLSQLVPVV